MDLENMNEADRQAQLLAEIAELRSELSKLKQTNCDLQIALETVTAHGDTIESDLRQTNQKLEIEISERQRAETALEAILEIVSQDKSDLEIMLKVTTEHGDSVEQELHREVIEAQINANIDGLTQIANRRHLDAYMAQAWADMARQHHSMAFILGDVDHFKLYNDCYGHQAGDECLRQVARALAITLRRPTDLAARYGGEEFALILPHTNAQGAILVCEHLQAAIAKLQIPHAQSLVNPYVTLSLGISSTVPIPGSSCESFIAVSDRALYQAKQQGRNCYVFKSYNALNNTLA
jgi:diguanylate cyclase (GGDEF)-like protein